jgi:hypothetical protein
MPEHTELIAHFGATIPLRDKPSEADVAESKPEPFALQLYVEVGKGVPIRFGLTLPPDKYVSLEDLLTHLGKLFGITEQLSFSGFWKKILELQIRPDISAGPSPKGGSADIKGSLILKEKLVLPPSSWWPEPFIEVKNISIYYKKGGLDFSVDADFFGRELTLEYPLSTPAPKVPLIDLKYFALGQRVGIDTEATDVLGTIEAMKEKIQQVDGEGITRNFVQLYKPDRHLLFAARLTIRDLIDLSVIFNDPLVYGLAISFGEKIAVLKGFKFEILYKKISDDVGLFYLDLSLPESIRQMEFGQASVTLPCIAISIYTNGDFKIAIGWPLGDRSLVVQLIVMIGPAPVPFLGGGGCYFGKLSSATTPDVPIEGLNPIIAFGLALEIGLGKSFKKGILSAQLSITLHGILEGRLGWHPPPEKAEDTGFDLMVPEYFMFQGTLGIAGVVEGQVSFAIVKAAVSVRIGADVTVRFETQKDVTITVSAYVNVALKVEIGGFKIFGKKIATTIKLSFKAHISETFVIKGTAAKSLPPQFRQPLMEEFFPIEWDPDLVLFSKGQNTLAEIPLVFMPQITLAQEGGKNKAQFVASLTISTDKQADNGPSPFEVLVEKVVVWMVYAWKNKTIPLAAAENETLSRDEVQQIIDSLSAARILSGSGSADRPLNYENLKKYLKSCIVFSISAAKDSPENSEQDNQNSAAAFPIFPDLQLEVTGKADRIDFKTTNRRTESFAAELEKYFDTMRSLFEIDKDTLAAKGILEPASSLATYIFEDYFAMLLKAAAGDMLDQFNALDCETITLKDLLSPYESDDRPGIKYELLAGTVSRFSYHGLRIPMEFKPEDNWPSMSTTPLYVATGQQFGIDIPEDISSEYAYDITLDNTGSEEWLTFSDPIPKFEIDDKKKLDALKSFEKLDLSLGDLTVAIADPLTEAPSRFVLQNQTSWFQDEDENPHTLLWISDPLEAAIASEILLKRPVDIDLYIRKVDDSKDYSDPKEENPLAFLPSLTIDLTLKQIETDSDADFSEQSTRLENAYQIGGTDENSRKLLKKLLSAAPLDIADIDILYPRDADTHNGELTSAKLSLDDVLLIKTNLSTDSNPDEAYFSKAIPKETDDGAVYSFLSNRLDFLRLIWECSIVNSGGFYLRYVTASEGDLPGSLFKNASSVSVQLVVSFAENTPLTAYHNTLIVVPQKIESKTSGAQELYSAVVRGLPEWKANIPAGCLTYEVTRDNPNNELNENLPPEAQDKIQMENLFNLIRCRIDQKGGFAKSIWGLPVGPIDVKPSENTNKNSSDQPDKWTYRQMIPAYRFSVPESKYTLNSRYAGIGKTIHLNFEALDLFGNRFPGVGIPDLKTELKYFDRLRSITGWPGIHAVYDIDYIDNKVRLVITLQFDHTMFKGVSENDDLENSKAKEAKKIYGMVHEQISDPNIVTCVSTTIAPIIDPKLPMDDLGQFVENIIKFLVGPKGIDDSGVPNLTMSFELKSEPPEDYLFPVKVNIKLSRKTAYDDRDPLIKEVDSEIVPNIRDKNPENSDSLAVFAKKFEAAFDGKVKLAQGPGKQDDCPVGAASVSDNIALFGVRFGKNNHGVEINFDAAKSPVYFALPPFSTNLLTEQFDQIIEYNSGNIDDITFVSKKFTDVDLDLWAREFLTALDGFIGPHLGIATCRVDSESYSILMAWKKSLASAIANRIELVFQEDADHVAAGDRKEAIDVFYQKLLIDLRAAYEIGTIVQAEAQVDVPAGITDACPRKLYGQIKKVNENKINNSNEAKDYQFSTSKLLLSAGRQLLTGLFSVAQPTTYVAEPTQIAYEVSFLEHDISKNGEPKDTEDKYLSSSWLKFVLAQKHNTENVKKSLPSDHLYFSVADSAEIPVPLRRYPDAPTLIQQNARKMTGSFESLEDAVLWRYELSYQQLSIPQDSFDLIVSYNKKVQPKPESKGPFVATGNRLRPLPNSLFEALARFHTEYPDLSSKFDILAKAAKNDKEARVIIDRFMELVEGVVHVLSPQQATRAKGGHNDATGLKEIKTRYYFNQQKNSDISVTRYSDAQEAWPSWPDIGGFTGESVLEEGRTRRYTKNKSDGDTEPAGRCWRHTVSFPDRDVRSMESALCSLQLFRNASLVNEKKTSDIFVYRTPFISFPSAITPLIEIKDPFDLKIFDKKTLSEYLFAFFDELLYKDSSQSEVFDSRQYDAALSVDMGFSLAERPAINGHQKEVINAKLPVALSPSLFIKKESLMDSIHSLVKNYRAWYEGLKLEANTSLHGSLFFDLKVFSSLSEYRLPIVHLSNVMIAIEKELNWWQ